MRSTYIFLPVAGRDLLRRRRETARTLNCLASALKVAAYVTGNVKIHVHVNGKYDASVFVRLAALLRARQFPTELTVDAVQDKISAVNFGLMESRRAGASSFVSVDNDLYIPDAALRNMLEIYHANGAARPVGCEKLPLVPKDATDFQRNFSVFGEFVVRSRILDTRRVSGSLYIVNPQTFGNFPSRCNEGDYLSQTGVVHSNQYIYSEYPRNFADEIKRRRRLAVAATATGFRREFQDSSVVSRWITLARPAETISHYRLWRPFLAFARVMLQDAPDSQALVEEVRLRGDAGSSARRRMINLVDFVDPVAIPARYFPIGG